MIGATPGPSVRAVSLLEAASEDLVWVHPDPSSLTSELRAGGKVVATLRMDGPWSGAATGAVDGVRWTFTTAGFVHPRVFVRAGDGEVAATVERPPFGWGGRPSRGRLASGREFLWGPTGATNLAYALTDESGATLLSVRHPLADPPWRRGGKKQLVVGIAAAARSRSELPLLVLLAKYLAR